jgi:sarcosine/dimethylglycine N-methyltransferase
MIVDFGGGPTVAALEQALYEAIVGAADGAADCEIAELDEWHCRGAEATTQLADLAGLRRGMHILDVGSGLGGAARRLSIDHGVEVTGIDCSRQYVQLARRLSRRSRLDGPVRFEHAHAESAPFATDSFDGAWLQHVLPNITDKARLFAELRRLIVPGGVLALHEIISLDSGAPRFPLPWAASPANSYPPRAERLRAALESAGFVLVAWQDTTEAARAWCARVLDRLQTEPPRPWTTPIGLSALQNFIEAVDGGRLGVAMGVFRSGRRRS